MTNRRNFIRNATLLSAAVSTPLVASTNEKQRTKIPENLTLLFQGDSITDAGRNRARYYPNDTWGGFGNGYALLAAAKLMSENPGTDWRVYNRGISGNKVHQLADRWEDDCLQINPDVLSILIGVNDFWHTLTHNYKGTIQTYLDDFSELLDRTKEKNPNVKLIIGEPFVCLEGSSIDREAWEGNFESYRVAAKEIATKYDAVWIPYQQVFDEALTKASVDFWCPDGVHPSVAGNQLMADAWLKAFYEINF